MRWPVVSPAVSYAAEAMGFMSLQGVEPIRVQELAAAIGAPAPYLAKIVHLLARRGLLETARGKGGGVVLACDPDQLTILDLCEVMDDDILSQRCALGQGLCSEANPCPAHELHMKVRDLQLEFLRKTTVREIGEFNARAKSGPNAVNGSND
jgi:Rrf2 family iron-sulfur cluster assembly transcriptional regulator